LVTPAIGVATATSVNKVTITEPTTSAILTIANGKTLKSNNSLTLAGTDATIMTFPSTTATIARTDAAQTFTGIQTFSSPITGSITGNAATATSATSFSGNLSGDVTGTQSATVVGKINGTSLAGLSTGLLKNTITTGIPSIATAGTDYAGGTSSLGTGILKSTTSTGALTIALASDYPTLNQSTTGNAANVTGTIAAANGGTGQTSYTMGDLLYASASNAVAKLADVAAL
jgi:hypothetical protein